VHQNPAVREMQLKKLKAKGKKDEFKTKIKKL
jgi:hypothetical protein